MMSVIFRSESRSSRKKPEFPSWMTVQNNFSQSELCLKKLIIIMSRLHRSRKSIPVFCKRDQTAMEGRLHQCITPFCNELEAVCI